MESNLGLTPNECGDADKNTHSSDDGGKAGEPYKGIEGEAEGAKVAVRNLRRDALAK